MAGIKVGLIGLGFMGEVHARYFTANPKVERLAVASPVPAEREKAQAKYGAVVYEDYREMLAKERPDAVDVCTPNATHPDMAVAGLEAGANVLVEKPLALSLPEIDRALETERRTGKKLLVAHSLRFSDAYAKGHELLVGGRIGDPVFLIGKYKWFKDFNKYSAWKRDSSASGGGMLMQSGIHIVDTLVWYAGARPVEVSGRADKLIFKDFPIEDNFIGTITFENGVLAHFIGSSATKGFIDYGVEVYGTTGALRVDSTAVPGSLDLDGHSVQLFQEQTDLGNQGVLMQPSLPRRDMWQVQVNHFVDVAEGSAEPLVSGEAARRTMQVLFGLYESARTGQPVRIQ
ncbi:MAG: Gfo/Idh/MocA family protein [Chitinophagales bacterium]